MTTGRTKTLVLALLAISLLAIGVYAMAHGFGRNGPADEGCYRPTEGCPYGLGRDADGDGVLNCADEDWSRPLDGSGYGPTTGCGTGPRSGNGYGPGHCWEN